MRLFSGSIQPALHPVEYTTQGGFVDGLAVDRLASGGASSGVLFTIFSGAITAGTLTVGFQDSDDGITWATVANEFQDFVLTDDEYQFDTGDGNAACDYGYLGSKRYIRLRLVPGGFSGFVSAIAVVNEASRLHLPRKTIEVQRILGPLAGLASQSTGSAFGGEQFQSVSYCAHVGASAGAGTTAVATTFAGITAGDLNAGEAAWFGGIDPATALAIAAADEDEIKSIAATSNQAANMLWAYGAGGPTSLVTLFAVCSRPHGEASEAAINIL